MSILNVFDTTKSEIAGPVTALVRLHESKTLAVIIANAELKDDMMLLNLLLFLVNRIVLMMLMIAAKIINFTLGLHLL